MNDPGIASFSRREQVASYDRDMTLMHPNRDKMIEVALQALPFPCDEPLTALDIGAGSGIFTAAFLARFPGSRVMAVDGAAAMVELAKARLGARQRQVEFHIGDFRGLRTLLGGRKGHVAFSSFALHHLDRADKLAVIRSAAAFLEPGGWFLNADLVVSESPQLEARIQALRVAGIVERAAGIDPRFATAASTRQFLDALEAAHHDRPLTLAEDLQILKEAGLAHSGVLWAEHREAVTGGF
jgi:tRNA (cmo5U34)-methyltransferase